MNHICELWDWRWHLISEEGSSRVSQGNFYLRDFVKGQLDFYPCANYPFLKSHGWLPYFLLTHMVCISANNCYYYCALEFRSLLSLKRHFQNGVNWWQAFFQVVLNVMLIQHCHWAEVSAKTHWEWVWKNPRLFLDQNVNFGPMVI